MASKNGASGGTRDGTVNRLPPEVRDLVHVSALMDPMIVNHLRIVANDLTMSRDALVNRLLDPRRSIDDECGFPKPGAVSPQMWKDLYDRDSYAARVVEVLPVECAQVQPSIYEDEDPEVSTDFEEGVDRLGSDLRGEDSWFHDEEGSPVNEHLRRLDILSGIGHYGVGLFGFDDGKPLSQPFVPKDGTKLAYLQAFPENLAQVTRWETDQKSPRYGQPTEYLITFNDPREDWQAAGIGLNTSTQNVHWTRVQHVADTWHQAPSNNHIAAPRCRPVLNNIIGLQKLLGGSPEGYWKMCFTLLALETHPQLGGDVLTDDAALRDVMENMMNSSQKYGIFKGMSLKSIAPTVVDPTPHVAIQEKAICIKLGMPLRVFQGSERGELSSGQDDDKWNDTLRGRNRDFKTPKLYVPFYDRLVWAGVLPKPKGSGEQKVTNAKARGFVVNKVRRGWTVNLPNEDGRSSGKGGLFVSDRGGWSCFWPPLDTQSEAEKADVALKKMTALSTYVSGQVATLLPESHALELVGYDDEAVQQILDDAKKQQLKDERDAAKLAEGHGMVPEAPPGYQHPEPDKPAQPTTLGAGQQLVHPETGKVLAKAPFPPKAGK